MGENRLPFLAMSSALPDHQYGDPSCRAHHHGLPVSTRSSRQEEGHLPHDAISPVHSNARPL